MALNSDIARYLEESAAHGAFPVDELTPQSARARMHPGYIAQFGEADAVGSVVDFMLPGSGIT